MTTVPMPMPHILSPISINAASGLRIIVRDVVRNPLPLRFTMSKRPARIKRGSDGITAVFSPERLVFLVGGVAGDLPLKSLFDGTVSRLDFSVVHTPELQDAIFGIINCQYRGAAYSLSLQAMVLYLMVEAFRQAEAGAQ